MSQVERYHIRVVEEQLQDTFYVCFEEPTDPMVWPKETMRRRTTLAKLCESHKELKCGWYRLVPGEPQ